MGAMDGLVTKPKSGNLSHTAGNRLFKSTKKIN